MQLACHVLFNWYRIELGMPAAPAGGSHQALCTLGHCLCAYVQYVHVSGLMYVMCAPLCTYLLHSSHVLLPVTLLYSLLPAGFCVPPTAPCVLLLMLVAALRV